MQTITILFLVLVMGVGRTTACTTEAVSGKRTPDGRPLLLKHRGMDELWNRIQDFGDGKYPRIGLMDAGDLPGSDIWDGVNSAGFAIMNSANYNLNHGDTISLRDQEGIIMKLTLQTCATVQEFEELLRVLPRPLGVETNFGVIDAQGGAAYLEAENDTVVKYNVNDPETAPSGYLIRTNFAVSGTREEDRGTISFCNAGSLLALADFAGTFIPPFLLREVSRSLRHSYTKIDLVENIPVNSDQPVFVPFHDFIPRYSTAAAVIVQGVQPGESSCEATLWTLLGFRLSAVVVPVWVAGGPALPRVLARDSTGTGPLCPMALRIKEKMFPDIRDAGRDYLNIAAVMNRHGDGILLKALPLEDAILTDAEQRLASWRGQSFQPGEPLQFYRWVDETITIGYQNLFGTSE